MIRRVFLILAAGVMLAACATTTPQPDAVYYLVRHAEKTTEKPDPGLTVEGERRAQDLAERLANVPLTVIYSSDYIRTLDTAAPITKAKGLDVTLYDPRDLEGLATMLLAKEGQFLVVGHSNTTPQLSGLLGGIEGDPIIEATEYNRLYVLQRRGDKIESRIDLFGK